MNISLTVLKPDETRETLDNSTLEMARAVFEKLDWDAELAAARAVSDGENIQYLPTFALEDASGRSIAIFPVDTTGVKFSVLSRGDAAGRLSYPKSEVPHLLGLYFDGDDAAIAALIADDSAVREVSLRELSDAEFRATIAPPMHRLGEDEDYRQIHLRDYLHTCILKHRLPVTLDTVELADIYLAADEKHSHIHFTYTDPDTVLAIVAEHKPDPEFDFILGHHFVKDSDGYYPS